MTLQEDLSSHVTIYTDSWAVFKGLTTWMPTWKSNEWLIHGKVVWGGKEVWDFIWKEAHSRTIKVGHVDAHVPLVPDFENYNRVADEIAKVNAVVPIDPVLMNLANWAHKQSGHLGQKATYEWAQQRGLPISMDMIRTVIGNCTVCGEVRQWPLQKYSTGSIKRGERPAEIWQIDFIGPLPRGNNGLRYCCTAVDTNSGLLFVHPCKRADQAATLQLLQKIVVAYGCPKQVQSDNGSHFTGSTVQQWAKDSGVYWLFHIPYHPQAAGLIERYNGLLKDQIRKLTPTRTLRGWDRVLTQAVMLLNFRPLEKAHHMKGWLGLGCRLHT